MQTLMHTVITCRIDYFNPLLCQCAKKNSTFTVVPKLSGMNDEEDKTDRSLHWLPLHDLEQRKIKCSKLVFKLLKKVSLLS